MLRGPLSGTIQIATYDATHDTWSISSESPPSWPDVGRVQVAYVDGAVVVSDMQQHAWQYFPAADTWSPEPGMPDDTVASSIAAFDGSTVAVAVTGDGALSASRDDGTWTALVGPAKTSIQQPIAVNAGGSLIVVDGSGQTTPVRLDEPTHTWAPLAGYPLAPGTTTTPVWASPGLFVWGGLPTGTTVAPPASPNSAAPSSPEAAWYGL